MACIATTPIGKSVGETIETCWESVMDYTTHRFEIPTLQDPRRTNAHTPNHHALSTIVSGTASDPVGWP
jgi:hypothetical protein